MNSEDAHLLLVDDDRRIRQLLADYLRGHGFRVTACANAQEARRALQGLTFDLIILDVMMPGEDGLSFAANLRAEGSGVPILMLSARSDTNDRIQGLATGSDDYVGKPFEPEELLLRLRALLRRSAKPPVRIKAVRFGDCSFEVETGALQRGGEPIHLTGREKDILRLLAERPGEAVSRVALQPQGADEAARAIDVQVNRLRQKIEKDPSKPRYLQTMRGQGYALFAEVVS